MKPPENPPMNEARSSGPMIDREAAAALMGPLTDLVIRAGAAILAVNRSAMKIDGKLDGSPVTEADLAADRTDQIVANPRTQQRRQFEGVGGGSGSRGVRHKVFPGEFRDRRGHGESRMLAGLIHCGRARCQQRRRSRKDGTVDEAARKSAHE